MAEAIFHFHGLLADFLTDDRPRPIAYRLNGEVAVKHPIEALGVPHPEVEFILANGRGVDFSYRVQAGDEIAVFPAGYQVPGGAEVRLRPPQPEPLGFVCDNHLGRLATYLRLLGFDCLYPTDLDDEALAELAQREERALLSRDRRLLMRRIVVYGCCLRSRDPRQQLQDVLDRFQLQDQIRPWRRCLRCNGRLEAAAKEAILDQLEPKTKLYYHEFWQCGQCRQIYWKGSHYQPLLEFVRAVLADQRRGG